MHSFSSHIESNKHSIKLNGFALFLLQALSQNRISNTRLKREVFFLNLEDGYFGCQVNESTDYLQLFELSKLCDGHSDCFMSSDESARELKCTSK